MKRILLFAFLTTTFLGFTQNLVFNGNMEQFTFPNSSPDGWSSSSDFGDFNQNTTDYTEGLSSVEFIAEFSDLMMFTTVDIPLEAGKTYTISYNYKYLGNNFDSNDNIEFSFYSATAPFLHGTNIQDNNWNTVTTQFTPTETKPDFEATIRVTPASGPDFDYRVLIDDVQVFEGTALSNNEFNLSKNISILSLKNNHFKIKKPADVFIKEVTAYSVLGQQKKLNSFSDTYNTLNLNTFSSGIYILKITTNNGSLVKKIIVK